MASAATLRPRCTMQPPTSARRQAPCRARFAAAATSTTAATLSATVSAPSSSSVETRTMSTRRAASVANMWRQVQGSDDWDGLLQPLHPVVRDEVARYGELVDACYDVLDMDPWSTRYMCCKHGKESVLDASRRGYEVTRYIYATPDVGASGRSSCVGYVAVSTDEMTRRLGRRDVLVAFRGTVTQAEWTANLMSSLEPAGFGARPDVRVESGFLNLYTSAADNAPCMGSCREQLLREVSRLITSFSNKHPAGGTDMSVTLAGHSMGSALAMLLGYDLAELGLNRGVPVTVFSFGGPRVGNAAFKARCDELGVKALRVANVRDPVTMVPGAFINERTRGLLGAWGGGDCYMHIGVELTLDFLRLRDLGSVHDLGTYVASLRAETGSDKQVSNHAAADGGCGLLAEAMEFAVAVQRALPRFRGRRSSKQAELGAIVGLV